MIEKNLEKTFKMIGIFNKFQLLKIYS